MIIAHFSDTHGLPRKGVPDEADLVVISGDIAPNRTRGNRDFEPVYQREWYERTIRDWKRWLGGRPLVFVQGNHDFYNPTAAFGRAGISALNVEDGVVEIEGVTFAGLPLIPWMGGEWNHEASEHQIGARFEAVMDHKPDVIVNHCPPYGVLDTPYGASVDYHIGSTAVARALEHHPHEPRAYLCGHCHEYGGKKATLRSTVVSNAATTRNIIKL